MTRHPLFPRGRSAGSIAVVLVAIAASARGDIIVNYQDVGSDLQFSWSGSLPFTPGSNTFSGTTASITRNTSLVTPQSLYAFDGSYKFQNMNSVRTPSGTGLFTGSTFSKAGTMTGDTFGISFPTTQAGDTSVFLPGSYTANDPILGTLTIPNFSIADAGLSPVSFALSQGGNITFQAVPEPSTWALCGVAAVGLGFAGVRRKRCQPPKLEEKVPATKTG